MPKTINPKDFYQSTDDPAKLRQLLENWIETAALEQQNTQFYRGLIQLIGEQFGDRAKTSDDGTIQSEILALKIPALVAELIKKIPSNRKGHRLVREDIVRQCITALEYKAHDEAAHSQGASLIDKEHTADWEAAQHLKACL